jgi:hypothetical protein
MWEEHTFPFRDPLTFLVAWKLLQDQDFSFPILVSSARLEDLGLGFRDLTLFSCYFICLKRVKNN